VEVPVQNENDCVATRVGAKGEDSGYGSFSGCKCAVVAGAETLFDAGAVCKGKKCGDEVVGVQDGIDVDGVVVCRGLVCELDDGCGPGGHCWEGESAEDSGVGPGETSRDTEHREGGGEKGGQGGGDQNGGSVNGGGIIGGEGA